MPTKIFVNLPVKNLDQSIAFFAALGYSFNPQFTDEKATCMIIAEDICVMLLAEDFFRTFITKEIADTSKNIESIICLSAESRDKVNELINKAVAAGGTTYKEPQDHGFMYQWAYQDLDGHLWEIAYMDMNAVNQLPNNQLHTNTVTN